MQINGSIGVSEIISELDRIDGVQSVTTLDIENKTGGGYSNTI